MFVDNLCNFWIVVISQNLSWLPIVGIRFTFLSVESIQPSSHPSIHPGIFLFFYWTLYLKLFLLWNNSNFFSYNNSIFSPITLSGLRTKVTKNLNYVLAIFNQTLLGANLLTTSCLIKIYNLVHSKRFLKVILSITINAVCAK